MVSLALYSFIGGPLNGQELEPRAFWIAPVGVNAATFSFVHSRGDFAVDPSLPVEDVDASVYATQAGYYRAINLLGRSANFTFTVPYIWGTVQGRVEGESTQIRRSGLADTSLRLSANLIGARAMTLPEFQKFRQDPPNILGVSFRLVAPTGQYDSNRPVNLGSNRWAFNPKIGWIHPIGRRWLLELQAGGWFFTDNQDFLGQKLEQAPLVAGAFNLIYRIRPGFWAALDTTYYWGGRTTVADQQLSNLQRNSRIGGTIALPIKGGHILKLSASSGISVDFGGNYNSLAIAYQYAWLDSP
jgi:hypothetical protein